MNFDLVPFLKGKLNTPDRRKGYVNRIIYRLLMTQILEGYPPIINVITSYIQIPGREYIAEKLLTDLLACGCQTVRRNAFGVLYLEQKGDKLVREMEAASDDWTTNTPGPASSSPQWHVPNMCCARRTSSALIPHFVKLFVLCGWKIPFKHNILIKRMVFLPAKKSGWEITVCI